MNWSTQRSTGTTLSRVVELLNEGKKQIDIAAELDISPPRVSQHAKQARERGLIKLNSNSKVKART